MDDLGIPDEQCLPVGIVHVDFDAPGAAGDTGDLCTEELPERTGDVSSTNSSISRALWGLSS